MALKGSLKDFPVSDIFQLIGQQQKSGSLFIKSNQKQARIIFDQGRILLCTFLESDDQFLLGNMLVNAKAITSEQLQEAILAQKTSSKSIGDTLIQMKQITAQTLSEFIRLQIDEVLFRVFQWNDGFFEFIPEKIKFNKSVLESQSAEGVLMDSFRKKDEWPRIQKTIDNTSQVFSPAALPNPVEMDESEKKVLSLFDGQRELQEVIHLSRLGTFETCRIASELLKKKAIQKSTSTNPGTASVANPTDSLFFWLKLNYFPVLVSISFVFAIPALFFETKDPLESNFKPKLSIKSLRRLNQSLQFETKIRSYYLDHGLFPSSLEDISAEISNDAAWLYERKGDTFVLSTQWTEP